MKKKISNILLSIIFLVGLSSCMGDHNKSVLESPNQDSKRIYGVKGGEPLQLNNTYPEDETGEVADRIFNIRDKFFPK